MLLWETADSYPSRNTSLLSALCKLHDGPLLYNMLDSATYRGFCLFVLAAWTEAVFEQLTSAEDLLLTSTHALAPKGKHKSMTKFQAALFF